MPKFVYRPTLRWKRGEKVAVQNLSVAGRADVIPIFVMSADQFRGREATKSRPAVSAAEVVVNDLMTYWPNSPAYLDASAIIGSPSAYHPIVDIIAVASSRGYPLMPATRQSAPIHYQQGVDIAHRNTGCGAGLRVDLQGLTTAGMWSSSWPIPVNATDLVVDFANNIAGALSLGPVLPAAFNGIHHSGIWRSVTVCGTTMPDNFGGYTAGIHIIPRAERALWQVLQPAISYRLDFGDYATVPLNPAGGNIAWGFPINVKYTLLNDFLVCRGIPTTGIGSQDMDVQLIDHAKSICSYSGRFPLSHCWSDIKIDNIASLIDSPGNLETWVQIGVSRHIEITRAHLP